MKVAVVLTSMVFVFSTAGTITFAYDDHGRHDPFLPLVSSAGDLISYDADLTANDMVLEGIVADPRGDNLAIINGKIVKQGDKVGPFIVAAVHVDRVELTKGQEQFLVKLKKGGM